MVKVTVISPAVDRAGQSVSSYHKVRTGPSKGQSLVKKGVARSTLSFDSYVEAAHYIATHPGPAYAFDRGTKNQISA